MVPMGSMGRPVAGGPPMGGPMCGASMGGSCIAPMSPSGKGGRSQVDLLRAALDCVAENANLDRQEMYLWVHNVIPNEVWQPLWDGLTADLLHQQNASEFQQGLPRPMRGGSVGGGPGGMNIYVHDMGCGGGQTGPPLDNSWRGQGPPMGSDPSWNVRAHYGSVPEPDEYSQEFCDGSQQFGKGSRDSPRQDWRQERRRGQSGQNWAEPPQGGCVGKGYGPTTAAGWNQPPMGSTNSRPGEDFGDAAQYGKGSLHVPGHGQGDPPGSPRPLSDRSQGARSESQTQVNEAISSWLDMDDGEGHVLTAVDLANWLRLLPRDRLHDGTTKAVAKRVLELSLTSQGFQMMLDEGRWQELGMEDERDAVLISRFFKSKQREIMMATEARKNAAINISLKGKRGEALVA